MRGDRPVCRECRTRSTRSPRSLSGRQLGRWAEARHPGGVGLSDAGALDERRPVDDALVAERHQIQCAVFAVGDPFRHGPADGRRLLHAVAEEPVGEDEILDLVVRPHHHIVVGRVVGVMAGPLTGDLEVLEGRHPMASTGHT